MPVDLKLLEDSAESLKGALASLLKRGADPRDQRCRETEHYANQAVQSFREGNAIQGLVCLCYAQQCADRLAEELRSASAA